MKKQTLTLISAAALMTGSQSFAADSIAEALDAGKAYGDFRLRYESVEQDNNKDDASAVTLRSRLGYTTGTVSGFSGTLEFEDSRVVAGQDEYSVDPIGINPGEYSVIADPEATEVDQAFLQYTTDNVTVKAGRQVLTLDNHRFVGHVGWRQDRQTFDALSVSATPAEGLNLTYAYLDQRNRILANEKDIDSKDHLLNASFKTSMGTLTGYAYLLEKDQDADNALDTYGVRFAGASDAGDMKVLYVAEYATQTKEEEGADDLDADYMMLEGGVVVSGITLKVGYEVLGSDDGGYGFFTPLATLHKFNGWADMFVLETPETGLVDMSLSASGKLAGGKWIVAYHDYETDESTDDGDDLGDEINLLYAKKFGKHYNAGIKYAAYSEGDAGTDTDKVWVWVGASF